jgi:hypothetical protein
MNNKITPEELKKRYLYQVSRFLPTKGWEETEKEISSLIDDMTEARCGDRTPDSEDVKAVISKLGKPSELAASYNDSKMHLIGPAYFPLFKKTLLIMEGIAFASYLLGLIVSGIEGTLVVEDFLSFFPAILGVFATVTIVFFIIERQGVKLDELFELENELPPVPVKKARISRSEPIIALVFSFLFLILILFFPQFFGGWSPVGEHMVPVFDLEVLRACNYFFIISFLAEVVRSVAELVEGRYSFRLLMVYIPAKIIAFVVVVVVLTNFSIWNPDIIPELQAVFPTVISPIRYEVLSGNLNTIILTVGAIGTFLDILVTIIKTVLYGRKSVQQV